MSNETWSNEGPKCPYCAHQYTADEPHYYNESSYTEEDCNGCGKTFSVEVYTSTSWACETVEDQA